MYMILYLARNIRFGDEVIVVGYKIGVFNLSSQTSNLKIKANLLKFNNFIWISRDN